MQENPPDPSRFKSVWWLRSFYRIVGCYTENIPLNLRWVFLLLESRFESNQIQARAMPILLNAPTGQSDGLV